MRLRGEGDYRPGAPEVNSGPLAVVTVVHGLPPASLGGTEVAALRLARALAPGIETTFFTPGLPGPGGLSRDGRRPIERAQVHRPPGPARSFEESFYREDVNAAFRALLAGGAPGTGRPFDLCHVHHLTHLSMALVAIAKAAGIPVIFTLHDYWMACGRGQLMDIDLAPCPGPTPAGCARCLGDQLAIGTPGARIGRRIRGALTPPAPATQVGSAAGAAPPTADAPAPAPLWTHLEALALTLRGAGRRGARLMAARQALAREALASADRVVAPSADLLGRFEALGFLPDPSRGRVLGNIPPAPPRALAAPPPSPPLRLIYVGSVIPTKGVHVLLDALKPLDEGRITLDILGPCPPFHRRPTYGADLKARGQPGVRWLGPLPPEEVAAHVAQAHALALPSIWPENAPVTLREALMLGVPVVASRIGGIPELVTEGVNGLLFPPGDAEALRRAILRLEDPALRGRLAQGALVTPAAAIGAQASEWEALYRGLARGGAVGGRPQAPSGSGDAGPLESGP